MGFPPHNAIVHRNELGEPTGWDVPGDDPYEPDDFLPADDDPDDGEEADDGYSWSIASAIYEIKVGAPNSTKINSAYEFLRAKTAHGTVEEMREIGLSLLHRMSEK